MVQEPIVEPVVYDNRMFVQDEPAPVIEEKKVVHEERRIIEHEPVHVQYAVVQKQQSAPQVVTSTSSAYETVQYVQEVHDDDDGEAIVVELKDDKPDVYQSMEEEEYRIETEVVQERM